MALWKIKNLFIRRGVMVALSPLIFTFVATYDLIKTRIDFDFDETAYIAEKFKDTWNYKEEQKQ